MTLLALSDLQLRLGPHAESPLALRGLELKLEAGEAMGVVGESGSGKSLTVRSIARILPSDWLLTGRIEFEGVDVVALRGRTLRMYQARDLGVVFQDPVAHINPVRTVGDFMTESLRLTLGYTAADAEGIVCGLLAEIGISDPAARLRQYPHQLSGGLLQRMMIAAALAASPKLILADEPTTALDVTTQADVIAVLDRMRRERAAALIFVTHDIELAAAFCDTIAVMYAGEIVEIQRADDLYHRPRHPYTAALLGARPNVDERAPRLEAIAGLPQNAFEAPPGCAFAPRCRYADARCSSHPPLEKDGDAAVRCVRSTEIAGELLAGVNL